MNTAAPTTFRLPPTATFDDRFAVEAEIEVEVNAVVETVEEEILVEDNALMIPVLAVMVCTVRSSIDKESTFKLQKFAVPVTFRSSPRIVLPLKSTKLLSPGVP